MKLDKIVRGQHNDKPFFFENGKVTMFNTVWDKDDIKTLVETANLLHLEGYEVKASNGVEKRVVNMFGSSCVIEVKTYDEDEEAV